MTKWFGVLFLGAMLSLSPSFGSPANAADHRDAPTVDEYSAIDINDVFMFRDPREPEPRCRTEHAGGCRPAVRVILPFPRKRAVSVEFTTRSDARPTAHIDFVFGPFGNSPDCPTAAACQSFKAFFPNDHVVKGFTTQGTPAATHLAPVINTAGDIKVFAGPREDPFFFATFEQSISIS
jgi:hypothetical protein